MRDFHWGHADGVFGASLATTVDDGRAVLLCPTLGLDDGRGTFALMVERASLGRFTGTLDEAREQAELVLARRYPK